MMPGQIRISDAIARSPDNLEKKESKEAMVAFWKMVIFTLSH